jgi:hypothetical protein
VLRTGGCPGELIEWNLTLTAHNRSQRPVGPPRPLPKGRHRLPTETVTPDPARTDRARHRPGTRADLRADRGRERRPSGPECRLQRTWASQIAFIGFVVTQPSFAYFGWSSPTRRARERRARRRIHARVYDVLQDGTASERAPASCRAPPTRRSPARRWRSTSSTSTTPRRE